MGICDKRKKMSKEIPNRLEKQQGWMVKKLTNKGF